VRTDATIGATLSATCHLRSVAGVNPLDVEGAKAFVNQLGEFRRERRLLDVVLALEEIDQVGRAGCDLFADGGRGQGSQSRTPPGWR
jgi:hypothetical protein